MNAMIRRTLSMTMFIASCVVASLTYGQNNQAANLIISVEHRSPVMAIEKLKPLLDPRGDIGRIADKLIINTTASNLVELEQALAEFDVPARRLVLSIDPSFGTDNNNADRQSMQALEFEQNVFTLSDNPSGDSLTIAPTGNTVTETLPENSAADSIPVQQEPAMTIAIAAEVTGTAAMAEVTTNGIDTLLPTYQVSMPLGQWVALEPSSDATMAIRVDVLP